MIIEDRAYEMRPDERDIYEHSLTEREVDMFLRKQALRRKLNRIELEDLQPGETPTEYLNIDYQNESGK